jgi:hypothetical protein
VLAAADTGVWPGPAMSPQLMRVAANVSVPWPSALFPLYVRAGSLVTIDSGNAALVAAYGGSSNLESVITDLGSADSLDKSWLGN